MDNIELLELMHKVNLSQQIQLLVWDYMALPKHERDATKLAEKIIKLFNEK